MASIPGPLVLIVGLVVSVISFFLNKKSFGFIGAYSLFLYLGLIILFYGFVKILIWYITRKTNEEKKAEAKPVGAPNQQNLQNNNANNPNAQNQNIQNNNQMAPQRASAFDEIQKKDFDEDRYRMVIRCKNCGMSHYVYSNFCSNCGARLPK